MSVDTGQSGLLLDGALPDYEARQFTAVVVDAPPERTYQAVRALDPDQVAQSFPPMRMLGRLRALPARLSHARPVAGTLGPERRPTPSLTWPSSPAWSTWWAWSVGS